MTIDEFLESGEGHRVTCYRGQCSLYSGYRLELAIGYGRTVEEATAHALSVYEVRKSLEADK